MFATRFSKLQACVMFAGVALAFSAGAQVKVGVFVPLTGDAAGYGQSALEAIQLAVKQKNDAGGVLGQKIELVVRDDGAKPEQSVTVAKRLATSDGVLVMLGSISSPASFAATQVALQTGTPQIVLLGTAQRITTQGNPWVFRGTIPDTKLSGDLVEFIIRKYPGKKKVGYLYVNDDFGRGGFEAFKARAESSGLTIVAEEKYAPGDLDFTSQLTKIQSENPDVFVDWSRYTEGALVAIQAKRKGMTLPHFGSEGLSHPNFIKLAGDASDGMMYPVPFSMTTQSGNNIAVTLAQDIKKTYNKEIEYTHALAYDAMRAVIFAIEKSGTTTDKLKFRDALKSLEFDSTRGKFKFDAKGDPTLLPSIVKLSSGKEQDANK
ncbi:ABC transporter substrate-binding protein [Polaromonas sp. JS666]|uniref:ABC transporter substrate-binding protein n=1 Tax=Polaromonas sp. (strain JS666 / ATCC BAA-500) TaxID=296591 RepID=UPI0000537312|nr:ABC transporter substrate-binding protein [Polaromonas sp. JS666]ABE42314.1 amino acid/amide ABC transporter substrate-binding protein, HAAT family [Polaromonas sp. JS666]